MQKGEDGIVEVIFGRMGTSNKIFVKFGVEHGLECNTYYLASHMDWSGLMIEGRSGWVNAFFVREDLLKECGFEELKPERAYQPAGYGGSHGQFGHPIRDGAHRKI